MVPETSTYTGTRAVHDADSHLMEAPDWLVANSDAPIRDRMPLLDLHGLESEAEIALAKARTGSRETYVPDPAKLMGQKNWSAVGAFDPVGRSRVLDRLGFRSQLVFSTYSHHDLIRVRGTPPIDDDLLYAMVDAHNRGMSTFCASDPRLLPAAFIALDVPKRALASAELALDLSCAGLEVPSYPVGPYGLTNPIYDPVFRMLEERRRPLLFHVGGGGRLVDPVFACNAPDGQGLSHIGETVLPCLTYMGIPAPLEMALAALVLDGVFERFPRLMCGIIEQGAAWLPGFVRRLDAALDQFARENQRGRLSMRPSEYVFRQVRVTPFPFEDISWIIEQTGANILMFGSDYPHDEGGDAPLEAFDSALERYGPSDRAAVLWRNFEELMGEGLPSELRVAAIADQDGSDDDRIRRRTGAPPAVHQRQALLRLLAREVAEHLNLRAAPAEIQQAVDEFRLENGLAELEDALRWMADESLDESSFVRVLEDEVLIAKLCRGLGESFMRSVADQIAVSTAYRRRSSVPNSRPRQ